MGGPVQVILFFESTEVLGLATIAYIGGLAQALALFFHKLRTHRVAEVAGAATLLLAVWLILTEVKLGTASSVKTSVADTMRSGLVAWDCVLLDFPGDGRGAFPKDAGYGFDGPPFPEQVL